MTWAASDFNVRRTTPAPAGAGHRAAIGDFWACISSAFLVLWILVVAVSFVVFFSPRNEVLV
jgi:hypothetical protein